MSIATESLKCRKYPPKQRLKPEFILLLPRKPKTRDVGTVRLELTIHRYRRSDGKSSTQACHQTFCRLTTGACCHACLGYVPAAEIPDWPRYSQIQSMGR